MKSPTPSISPTVNDNSYCRPTAAKDCCPLGPNGSRSRLWPLPRNTSYLRAHQPSCPPIPTSTNRMATRHTSTSDSRVAKTTSRRTRTAPKWISTPLEQRHQKGNPSQIIVHAAPSSPIITLCQSESTGASHASWKIVWESDAVPGHSGDRDRRRDSPGRRPRGAVGGAVLAGAIPDGLPRSGGRHRYRGSGRGMGRAPRLPCPTTVPRAGHAELGRSPRRSRHRSTRCRPGRAVVIMLVPPFLASPSVFAAAGTMSAPDGWLARFLADPWGVIHQVLVALRDWVLVWGPVAGPGLALAAAVAVWARRAWRHRCQQRLHTHARVITVLASPSVDPAGAVGVWSNLVGLLRPAWRRLVTGQPHLACEYVFTHEGVRIQFWVPGAVPPGMVERAVEAAWPGAHTTAAPAEPPLPVTPGPGRRMLVTGG